MQVFGFIPNWRLDDLMISYASSGGSVGPHTDQYDVFLLQVEGRRRWQIARCFDPALLENCPLNILRQFTPEQEWILEPGDMLYLPPNVAHHGVALEPGMTYSVGSRAPSGADLLQGLGEWLAFADDEGGRYSDPDLLPVARAGEIDSRALQGLRELMLAQLDKDEDLHDFLAAFVSRFRLAHDPAPPAEIICANDVLLAIREGAELSRHPWTRLTWVKTANGARLFAAGQSYACSTPLAEALCGNDPLRFNFGSPDRAALETLTDLINDGHFVISMP
jgi:50S ribosomal protein L16 3-hydroxylase